MCILDIKEQKSIALRKVRSYLIITLVCMVFGMVYEHYSFGVYSNYMIYSFVFPLVGGVIFWFSIGYSSGKIYYNRVVSNAQAFAIATFTVGWIFKGIIDIYGTTSRLFNIYCIVGVIFAIISFLGLVWANLTKDNKKNN